MRYIYYNPTEQSTMVALLTSPTSSVSHIVIPANSKLELAGPFLDVYVPHKLQRVNELGQDISKLVIANRAASEQAAKKTAAVKELEPAPVIVEPTVVADPVEEKAAPEVKPTKKSAK